MQDELGCVAISAAVGGVIRDTIPIVLAEYGICMSMSKRAEDEAAIEGVQPNERMLYIGAGFYMHECERPRFRGQGKSLARFEEAMREWSAFSHFTGPTGAAAALTTPGWHVPLPWTFSVAGAALSQQRHSVGRRVPIHFAFRGGPDEPTPVISYLLCRCAGKQRVATEINQVRWRLKVLA